MLRLKKVLYVADLNGEACTYDEAIAACCGGVPEPPCEAGTALTPGDDEQEFWRRVLTHTKDVSRVHNLAVEYWTDPSEDGWIVLRDGFPAGSPYRGVAQRLAAEGVVNRDGQPFHAYHTYELVREGLVRKLQGTLEPRLRTYVEQNMRMKRRTNHRRNGGTK